MQKSLVISNFKEKFATFSMKTTDSKDLVKVNQILPIMQEYFGNSMNLVRIESRLPKLFERLSQYDLLILDDFAIKKLTAEQVLDLMEIIEDRHGNKSTIFASQLPVANWYETLDSNVSAADAILDRVVNTASRFALKGDSLRKKQ